MTAATRPLAELHAGMRLAVDIRDASGAVLLTAGCELSDGLIAAMRRRGIDSATVDQAATLTPAEMEARREAIRTRLAQLFRHAGDTVADRQLFEILLDYRLEQ
jgi:hypothetical protein